MIIHIPAAVIAILLHLVPPCQTEDSSACGWNAQEQGDGMGHSFIALTDSLILN